MRVVCWLGARKAWSLEWISLRTCNDININSCGNLWPRIWQMCYVATAVPPAFQLPRCSQARNDFAKTTRRRHALHSPCRGVGDDRRKVQNQVCCGRFGEVIRRGNYGNHYQYSHHQTWHTDTKHFMNHYQLMNQISYIPVLFTMILTMGTHHH